GNPLIASQQITGASTAIRATWEPLRRAGAVTRTMLIQAAAQRWNVDAATCRAEKGDVIHAPTKRRLKYGAIASDAAKVPVPDAQSVTLKSTKDFRLIGTAAKRLDTRGKVNGSAVYGIDAKVPGMKIAALAVSPVFGGRVRSV